jgi:hypothetical protein
MSQYAWVIGLLFCFPLLCSAVTDEFTVRTLVGEDTISPTTPTLMSVVPIATTQIDVDWSMATDNFLLAGYVLLRDGLPIATTTQTSYSDTGRTASTTYSYAVYAFDEWGNISSTSNSIATTTPTPPVIPPAATSTLRQGGAEATQVVSLKDLVITPGTQVVTVTWKTSLPARYVLRWGRTDAYTGGYITNEVYAIENSATITDLEPGTVYQYELIVYTPSGIALTLSSGQFRTTTALENRVVSNVSHLTSTVTGTDVELTYALPALETGAKVRIVRSHLGFPRDLYDGAIVYEGSDSTWLDVGALRDYSEQYYTVFVIAADGSVSSGAVVFVSRIDFDSPQSGSTTVPRATSTLPEVFLPQLSLEDISIRQRGELFTFLQETIVLAHDDAFTIHISKDVLPEHLKSIIVTIIDPTDQRRSYSFLLRINKAGTAYEATIAPLMVIGASRIEVAVYDYTQRVIGRYRKPVDFVSLAPLEPVVVFPDSFVSPLVTASTIMSRILLLFGVIWGVVWFRRRRAEDKQ